MDWKIALSLVFMVAYIGYLQYQMDRLRRETKQGLKDVSQVRVLPENVKVLAIPESGISPTSESGVARLSGWSIRCDAVLVQADSAYVSGNSFVVGDTDKPSLELHPYSAIS